ncbi:MAG: VWA domain-containing protein [Vicinamibacteria bacterium]|nr:VWA domain-containing protein [Vicinamibacteria bacterium]
MIGRVPSLLALMLGLAAPPPQVQTTPAPAPVFGADAELVLVDAVVTDKAGRPVLDLVREDFRLLVDGVEREIVSFAAFGSAATRARAEAASGPAPSGPAAVAPAFVPSSTVIYIDEGHLTAAQSTRLDSFFAAILRKLSDRRGSVLVLAPWSKVAFAGQLPGDLALLTDAVKHRRGERVTQLSSWPMTDAEAFRIDQGDPEALDRVTARFHYVNPGLGRHTADLVRNQASQQVAEERARRADTFEAMKIGFAWLWKQPGRHTFLLVTSGFPNDPSDDGFREMMNHSLRVNAPVHFLDVAGMEVTPEFEGIEYRYALPTEARVSPLDSVEASGGSDLLALDTGGLRVADNDIERGFERILDATRLYYILGVEPSPRGKRGLHKIKVEVRRKGLQVRARRGYFDPGPASPPKEPKQQP